MMLLVMALSLLAASMAGGLAVSSQTERHIAATHRRAVQLGYVAEGVAERVVTQVEGLADWQPVPGTLTVGPVEITADLAARTASANRSLAGRFPMGADTPRWRVVATGREADTTWTAWIADDPADRDGNPDEDSNGRIVIRSEARTALGAVRTVDVHLARTPDGTRRLSWREVW